MEVLGISIVPLIIVYAIWKTLENFGEAWAERGRREHKERLERLRSPEKDIVREARLYSEGNDRYGHGR